MDAAQFRDTGVADALAAKVGPDIGPADSPPGKTLAEMDPETLAAVLVAVEGTARALQQVAWTRPLGTAAQRDLAETLGRLTTAGNQLRRHLAGLEPAA